MTLVLLDVPLEDMLGAAGAGVDLGALVRAGAGSLLRGVLDVRGAGVAGGGLRGAVDVQGAGVAGVG